MKLVFGVVDVPYQTHLPAAARRHSNRPRHGSETTGDVAEILEAKYHVMEHFFELHAGEISDALTQSLADSLQDVLAGAPPSNAPFLAAESQIATAFAKCIDSRELEGIGYPGIPTQAALKGVNHRRKHPYAKGNPPRPSFRDTGLYEQSFRAKVEE